MADVKLSEVFDEESELMLEKDSYYPAAVTKSYSAFREFFIVTGSIISLVLVVVCLVSFNVLPYFSNITSELQFQDAGRTCHNPNLRREWRALQEEERSDFISAIQCLHGSPSKLNLTTTRYDDFVYVHVNLYSGNHNFAPSLPWHRYYIKVFENALRDECGFTGYLPYWDWTVDAEKPEESSIWSNTTGFGGNGAQDSHCLEDGPFKNFKPQYAEEHCLKRNFLPGMLGFNYTSEVIQHLWQNTTSYHEFRLLFESGAHKSVHNGIGGEMPTHGSSNDPIFFVHHGQIDRIWWHWQQLQPELRMRDYSGPNNAAAETHGDTHAKLTDNLRMMGLDIDRAVEGMMDTRSDFMCYHY